MAQQFESQIYDQDTAFDSDKEVNIGQLAAGHSVSEGNKKRKRMSLLASDSKRKLQAIADDSDSDGNDGSDTSSIEAIIDPAANKIDSTQGDQLSAATAKTSKKKRPSVSFHYIERESILTREIF